MMRPEAIAEEPTLLTSKSPVGDVKSVPDVSQSVPRSTPTRFNQDLVRVDSRRRMMRPEPIPEEPTSSVPTSPADSSQKPMEDIKATEAMTEAPLRSSPSKVLSASLTMENEDKLAQPPVDETGPKVSDFVLESASSQQSRTAVDTLPNLTVTAPSVPDANVLPTVISVPEAVVASSAPSTSQEKEEARSQTSDVDDDVKSDVPAEDSKVLSTTNLTAPISTDAAQTQPPGSPHGVRNQRSLEEEFKLAETNFLPPVTTAASDVGFKTGAECTRSSPLGSTADQVAPLQVLGEPKSLQGTQQAKDDHRHGQKEEGGKEESESSKEEAIKDEHIEDNDKDDDDDDDDGGGEVKSESQASSDSNSEHSPVGLSQQGAPTLPHSGIGKAHSKDEEEDEKEEEEEEEEEDDDDDDDEEEEDGEEEEEEEEEEKEEEEEEEEEEERHGNIEGPQLLAITPTSGPTTGNLMVKVYGRGLEESVMRHAVILVDDCTLRDSDWSLASVGEAGGTPQGATHCLTIRLPTPLTAGRVFVELETVAHGRLRCPQAFIAVAGRPSYAARGTGQVANLLKAVEEANKQIAQMRMTVSALESDVAAKCSEEARISGELYRLRMRLLEDGGLKYLERQ
nr:unnamed protein product [Spirometra erinaceieuropaei]